MELYYTEAGPAEGHPVFFLHGLFGNAKNWGPTVAALARSGFRCISLDQRNHGKSPHSDLMDYPSMADDLVELADRLGIGRFSAVGHSMGGKTAMEAALSAPGRIASLAVVDIAPVAYEPRYIDSLQALRALDLRTVGQKSDADLFLKDRIPDLQLRLFFLTNLVRENDGAYEWRINLEGIGSNYAALWKALDGGRSFEGPTVFIRGGESNFVAESHRPTMHALFPAFRCVTIEGAGHWVATDRPEAFLRALADFLGGK
jgi:esterase